MRVLERILMNKFLARARAMVTYYLPKMEKSVNVHKCMDYLQWISKGMPTPPAYCEFGVANGYTMSSAYFISRMYPGLRGMRFFGFDSFQGMPDSSLEKDGNPNWRAGDYAYSIGHAARELRRAGMPEGGFTLVPGFFEQSLTPETATREGLANIGYVHIDCDYYSSAKLALDFVKPYLIEGAVLDFDDFHCYPSPEKGEAQALHEWIEENPDLRVRHFSRYGGFGDSYTVSRAV